MGHPQKDIFDFQGAIPIQDLKSRKIISVIMSVVIFILIGNSCIHKETESNQETGYIDVARARAQVEALAKQFSNEFKNKDSIALANHYLSDGMLGSVKGRDNIVSAWSRMIQNASDRGTPNLLFITNSITTDDEFIIELGVARWTDQDGNVKSEGKYLVVYKQVGDELKLYRDWGL